MKWSDLNPLSWLGSAATSITESLTKKRNITAEGKRAVKEAQAYAIKVGADAHLKELDIDLAATKGQQYTWKDEYALVIATAPLSIVVVGAFVALMPLTLFLLKGDITVADYLTSLVALSTLMVDTLKSFPPDYYYILTAALFAALGIRGVLKGVDTFLGSNAATSQRDELLKIIQTIKHVEQERTIAETTIHPVTKLAHKHLKQSEGYFGKPTPDSRGILTLWHGLNLEQADDPELASLVLTYLIDQRRASLSKFEWYIKLDDARRAAAVRAAYWLGVPGFVKGFPKCIAALGRKDWQSAHDEFMDSKMGRGEQNPDGGKDGMKERAQAIADTFLTGE